MIFTNRRILIIIRCSDNYQKYFNIPSLSRSANLAAYNCASNQGNLGMRVMVERMIEKMQDQGLEIELITLASNNTPKNKILIGSCR